MSGHVRHDVSDVNSVSNYLVPRAMSETMKNKVVMITGAANGIGLECAKLFAQRGAHLMLSDIDESTGKPAVA